MQACLFLFAALAGGFAAFCVTDGAVRKAIHFSLARRFGGPFSPDIVVVGDSLAASCPWRRLVKRPFGVLNLATGGATLKEIAGQIYRSRDLGAPCLLIDGGLNDLLFDESDARQIETDFSALLRRIESPEKVVVTLMPLVADTGRAASIREANAILSQLCHQRGYQVLDINALVSFGDARRPDMTDDGLHFTPAAEALWLAAVDSALRGSHPARAARDRAARKR